MSDEGLVDILLVRLGRDEEKERVKGLLIKELGFSEEEAEKAVAKTPNMIKKAVPMGKGRVIQNRLYPYIDLLPRMDLVDEEPEEEEGGEASPEPAAEPEADTAEQPPESDDGREVEEDVPGLESAAAAVMETGFAEGEDRSGTEPEAGPAEKTAAPSRPPGPTGGEGGEEDEEESEGMVVTSAAEEMRQVERCHICGRTPTDGERLAPCRSCGDLTCRDCFDRVAHVCKKCAEDGKYVDRPPQRQQAEATRTEAPRRRPAAAPPAAAAGGGGYNRGLIAGVTAALVVLILLAVAYFIDPLGMFAEASAPDPSPGGGASGDSPGAVADTASTDTTSSVASDTASVDSLASADTTGTGPAEVDGPLNLAAATLDSASALADPVQIRELTRSGVAGLEILDQELEELAPDIGRIASAASISIDGVTLFRTDGGITVLALSVLHPEEDTRRYALLRGLGHYLAPTGVDELVFYYRENRYYDARVVPYLNAEFEGLSQATGPMEFQELTGCTSSGQWELLDGPVRDWLTSI
jgi:hypothetical protein